MITYKKEGNILKEISTKEKVYDLQELQSEMDGIDNEISKAEKEPDIITIANDDKFYRLEELKSRKNRLINLLEK